MPFKIIWFLVIFFMLHGCLNTTDEPEAPKPGISGNGEVTDATAEKPLSETPSTETQFLNTYSSIVKCVDNLGSADADKKNKFKENLSKLVKELSPLVEHAKPISLSLMIVNGKVPQKCLNNSLVDETH
jgi:hypothetical protein